MLKASEPDQRLAYTRQYNGPNKCPRYGARECEVIVDRGEAVGYVVGWCAVDENVMGRLEVERLFDFGMW